MSLSLPMSFDSASTDVALFFVYTVVCAFVLELYVLRAELCKVEDRSSLEREVVVVHLTSSVVNICY